MTTPTPSLAAAFGLSPWLRALRVAATRDRRILTRRLLSSALYPLRILTVAAQTDQV
jgi:hypothetical protein